ncbi:MAG: IS110 family transposase [Spirochaetes bacterium]|nr:IS110 family transposase [Spirochaetota bacterium]
MQHYIGIDNSYSDHKVQIIDENDNKIMFFSIRNTFDGFEMLNKQLSKLENIKIGFELPHGPLVDYLHYKNYKLYSLNPLKVKRFKELKTISGNKSDEIDSLAIAQYLQSNIRNTRELTYNSSEIERLKLLSVVHDRITRDHTRHINKLHFCIRQYYPIQEVLFSSFGCIVQLEMIKKYPVFEVLKQAKAEELTAFLKTHSYRNQAYINKIIKKIQEHRQLISKDVESIYQIEAELLCNILRDLNTSLKKIEKEMNIICDNHRLGKYIKSLPGAGHILSCKILALFGDQKNRFDNYNQPQCLFGTAPKNYQSGQFHKVLMRKSCDKNAKSLLYKFAFSTLRYSDWSRKYYDKQRSKGKLHSVSIRALSNKWVKIIFKIWKDEIFYEDMQKNLAVA